MAEFLDKVLADAAGDPGALITTLQRVQGELGHVPPETIGRIAETLGVFPSQIFGVLTFYGQFRLTPVGDHMVRVCHGTACHVGGAERVMAAACEELGLKEGGTSDDGGFTVEKVFCVGCCSLAPVVMVDDRTYGRLNQARVRKVVRDWQAKRKNGE